MKPELLSQIDKIQDAKLGMVVTAEANTAKIEECQTWMMTQDEYKDKKIEFKAQLAYRDVQITPSAFPIGGDGFVVRATSK